MVYMYCILTVHLSVVGHLGCSPFLAIVSRTATNRTEQGPGPYEVESFEHMPRSGTAGSYVDFFLAFCEFTTLISTVLHLCNPSNCKCGFPFPCTPFSCIFGSFTHLCHSDWDQLTPQTCLICSSLISRDRELSIYILSQFFFSFETSPIRSQAHYSKGSFVAFFFF